MKFMYLVRRDEEWHKGYNYSKILGKSLQSKRMAEFWNSTFTTSWIDFRIKLDKIREENQRDMNYDKTMSTYEIKSPKQFDGYVVVPCDDDDWLRGDIFDVLRDNYTGKHYSYRWNFVELAIIDNGISECRSFSYPTNIPFPAWRLTYNYQSNNYAIDNPKEFDLVDLHGYADQNLDIRKEKFIPMDLSIHNASLASLTFMRRTERWYGDLKTGLIDMRRRLIEHPPVQNTAIPEYFDKYINMTIDLHRSLKVK